jgi:hypothetical protein
MICVLVVLSTPLLLTADTGDDVKKELKALPMNFFRLRGGLASFCPHFPSLGS